MFQPLIAVIASISQAGSQTIDKFIVSKQKINFKLYLVSSYIIISLLALPLFIFFGSIQPQALETWWIFLLVLGIIFTTAVNIIYYRALQHEKITQLQPVTLLAPLFTVLVAGFFLPEERNYLIIGLAIISSLALVWAHFDIKKHNLKFDKYVLSLLLFSILVSPFSAIITKKLLTVYDPFAFEFIRTALAIPIFYIILRPSFKPLKKKNPTFLILTNVLTTAAWILVLFSYKWIGIIQTTLIFNLSPLLVCLFASKYLKEKMKPKEIIALVIILACVTISQVYKYF